MTPSFAVTWDYRCPFARNAHDHLVEALLDGAPWDVAFTPFSLSQAHVPEGGAPVWDEPSRDSGLLALQAGVAVRDLFPERFLRAHRALFDARHAHGLDLRDEEVVRGVLASTEVDVDAVFAELATGGPLATVRREHEAAVTGADVWGVPTFVAEGRSVFVRLMEGAQGDPVRARRTIERVVDLAVGWPLLNELKHTTIPR